MMRKLALTVFAISLTAFGCGSDSGDGKKDAAIDGGAKMDTAGKMDGVVVPDAMIKTDTTPTVTPDGSVGDAAAKLDGTVTTTDVDAKTDVVPTVDTGVKLDVTPAVDTAKDGGVVDAPSVDAPSVDAPAVDAGGDAGDAGNNG